jgi:aspartyl-tRNA(Asn)/glutamyl-tRNA(Gln) amidotransferase subunit A
VPAIDEAMVFETLLVTVSAEAAHSLDELLTVEQLRHVAAPIQRLLEQGRTERATEYSSAQRCRAQLRATVDDDLSGLDALLTPTIATVAKHWDAPDLDDWSIARFLPAFNLTGHPAISVPVPSERLPIGIQVVGHRGQDHALLATARWIEQHVP